jgi:hypothetical protein
MIRPIFRAVHIWTPFIVVALSVLSLNHAMAQSSTEPIFVGFEAGSGVTIWQHATPTYFSTVYPFPPGADTVQVPFRSGATALFGFYAGLAGDFYLDSHWSILAKFAYAEWRGEWNSTEPIDFDTNGVAGTIPVTSDLTFLVRSLALEGFLKYRFEGMGGFYLGAGVDVRALATSHYDLQRTIEGGPSDLSFVDFSTGQGTGVRTYTIGGEQPVASAIADVNVLAGIPIQLSDRWSINPEVSFGLPLMSIWTSSKQAEYNSTTYGQGPEPIAITGILALRYRAQ